MKYESTLIIVIIPKISETNVYMLVYDQTYYFFFNSYFLEYCFTQFFIMKIKLTCSQFTYSQCRIFLFLEGGGRGVRPKFYPGSTYLYTPLQTRSCVTRVARTAIPTPRPNPQGERSNSHHSPIDMAARVIESCMLFTKSSFYRTGLRIKPVQIILCLNYCF